MHFVITIIEPHRADTYTQILRQYRLPVALELHGRGTIPKNMSDLLGLEARPKRALFTVASDTVTEQLMHEVRNRLYIDAPGNGITIAIPLKSVAGARTLEYLNGGEAFVMTPKKDPYENELIVTISNEGWSDAVMDAARAAGARGGTVLHGKGTAKSELNRFYNVNITGEKELVLIVASSGVKKEIMTAILRSCGPATDAGGIVFSVPVSTAMGMSIPEA